jgi:hypothetical protein
MPQDVRIRRHADGALDIDHHRRVARRLRHLALRRAWRAVLRPTPSLRTAARLALAALLLPFSK